MIFRAILIWTRVFSRRRKCTFNSQLIVIFQHRLQEFLAYSVVRANRYSLHLAARTSRVKSTPNSRVERWTWTIHSFVKTPIHHYLRSNDEQHQQHSTIFWQWHHWWSCNVANFTFFSKFRFCTEKTAPSLDRFSFDSCKRKQTYILGTC